MIEDPIVEEVRKAGQAYVDSFKGDWHALFEDLRRRADRAIASGQAVAPPRDQASQTQPSATRKVG